MISVLIVLAVGGWFGWMAHDYCDEKPKTEEVEKDVP